MALHRVGLLSESVGKAASYLYLFVIGAVVFEIVSRYVFSTPTHWVQEATEFSCGIAVILGGAYALKENSHVRMEVLHNELPPKRQALADVLTFPFFVLFTVVLLRYTSVFAWKSLLLGEVTNSAWAPPIWPVKMLIPVGVALLLLQGIANFVRDIRKVLEKHHVD